MKRFLLILMAACSVFLAEAQDSSSEKRPETIADKINRAEPGKGSVQVIQDESIARRLSRQERKDTESAVAYVDMSGYRIQVFAGNNQRVSKNEAYLKEADIKSVFPELSTYVGFTAPFWRLRVGDFQSFQEAQGMMVRIRSEFPSYGKEMSIVRDKVRVKVK